MEKQVQKRWSDREVRRMRRLMSQGFTMRMVARKLGRTHASVKNKIKMLQEKKMFVKTKSAVEFESVYKPETMPNPFDNKSCKSQFDIMYYRRR